MVPALAALLFVIVAPAPVAAKDWGGLVASARRMYFVPLEAVPYDATLSVTTDLSGMRDTRLRETLAEPEVFDQFNAAALTALKARFGDRLEPVPERFRFEKKLLGGKAWTYDWKAMDCEFYVLAQIESPGAERGAHFRMSRFDTEKRATYVSLMPAPVTLVLYHKPKPDHSGKRVALAGADLLGPHRFQMVSGKTEEQVIEETVEAESAGREPADPVETYHFAWSRKVYDGQPGKLADGFSRHGARLRAKFRERLFSVIDAFGRALDKKLN
ncbi:MAG: hypothetical protein HY553_05415 [Elusimicrobia bacterium]|nr:hypothetical protein [Elusimicrobiota bacterium]